MASDVDRLAQQNEERKKAIFQAVDVAQQAAKYAAKYAALAEEMATAAAAGGEAFLMLLSRVAAQIAAAAADSARSAANSVSEMDLAWLCDERQKQVCTKACYWRSLMSCLCSRLLHVLVSFISRIALSGDRIGRSSTECTWEHHLQ